jgi:hypothetical protein
MFCRPCIIVYLYNKDQLDALFTFSLILINNLLPFDAVVYSQLITGWDTNCLARQMWILDVPCPVVHFLKIWYDICLTAIGLTPGSSSTVHIYTQKYTEYREWNIHNNQKILPSNLGSAGCAPSLQVIPWHLPYKWGKSA